MPTIDNLPPEIRALIISKLDRTRDLLALRSTSRSWRLLMTGRRAPIYTQCRSLLPNKALKRLAAHPDGNIVACIVYATLTTARVSLCSIDPTERDGMTHWVPLVSGALSGWGLAIEAAPSPKRRHPPAQWAIGRWFDGVLVDGVTRAAHVVGAIQGDNWHWCASPDTPACEDALRNAQWIGPIVDGVGHGRGVWEASDRGQCRHRDTSCRVRCIGTWSNGQLVRGTMAWADGHVYTGQFKSGAFCGLGSLDMGRGARYAGQWSAGQPHGDGMLYDNGLHRGRIDTRPSLYKGQWRRGTQYGLGTKRWANGEQYHGKWANGQPYGHGCHIYADGSRYEGKSKYGSRHGRGTFFGPDGRRQGRRFWIHGEPCSGIVFRHYKETGQKRSTTRCILSVLAIPLHDISKWMADWRDDFWLFNYGRINF